MNQVRGFRAGHHTEISMIKIAQSDGRTYKFIPPTKLEDFTTVVQIEGKSH
jgi:hypothetical protein